MDPREEQDRREIFESLEQVHGPEIARKMRLEQRFDHAEERSDRFPTHADLAAVEQRVIAAFRGELVAAVTAQTRMLIFGLIGTALTFGSLVIAAARLFA